jgi:hypothetical protein
MGEISTSTALESQPRTCRYVARGLAFPTGSKIRIAQLYGRDHLVVPVVALIGGAVVRPMGSDGWEYVPPNVLSESPHLWNGRPVVPVHPLNGTSSANTPQILSTHGFGSLFNSRFEGGRLLVDAYIDKDRAEGVGRGADKVVAAALRALAGEDVAPVEISVGAYVAMVEDPGTSPKGEAYTYRWLSVAPDHLALGLDGAEGACSVEMGCGALRAAERKALTPMKDRRSEGPKSLILASNLRQMLEAALSEMESAEWLSVEDVDDTYCFYTLRMENEASKMYRRPYEMAQDGTITIGGPREQVVPQRAYVPVTIDSEPSAMAEDTQDSPETEQAALESGADAGAPCSCGGGTHSLATTPEQSMEKKVLVAGLIACKDSPFTTESQLAEFDEKTLQSLCQAYGAGEKPAPVAPEPITAEVEASASAPGTAEKVTLTRADFDRLQRAVQALEANESASKANLVASLVAAQSHLEAPVYDQAALEAMDLATLQGTQRLVGALQPQTQGYQGDQPAYIGQTGPIATAPKEPALRTFEQWLPLAQSRAKAKEAN